MWPHTYTHRFGVDGIHHPELHRRNCSLMEGKGMAKNNKFMSKLSITIITLFYKNSVIRRENELKSSNEFLTVLMVNF